MKVYIAGPMTGIKHFNFPAFDRAQEHLLYSYEEVFSPADHDRKLVGRPQGWMPEESDSIGPWLKWAIPEAPSLRKMLGDDLDWICENATDMYMLQGWESSKGARTEHALAVALNLGITYEWRV